MAKTIKNIRHGRIRILSGDTVPLIKNVDFSLGNFTYTEVAPTNIISDRGKNTGITRGDDEPVTWSFGARFLDCTLERTLRDKVWDAQTQIFPGLTPSANNLLTPTYAFEQGSVIGGPGETITKLAPGVAPTADNELSEAVGVADVEGVIEVAIAAGAIQVFQPAADVDRTLVYDAVGQTVLPVPANAACAGSRKTFRLELLIYDVCFPPDPEDPTVGVVEKTIVLNNSWVEEITFTEGDEADELTFSGRSLIDKVLFV